MMRQRNPAGLGGSLPLLSQSWWGTAIAAAVCCAASPHPASAQNNKQKPAGLNITVQQPVFGVAVDADGVLTHKSVADPGGRLRAERLAAAKQSLPADVMAPSKLRKVSLIRLERVIEKRLAAGRPLDDEMRHLAGLTRLQYVFFYPDTKELVIAGPAEGWAADPLERMVGVRTGRPVLRLDDLLVALRAYPPRGPAVAWLGCSIGPTTEGLKRLREFQRTIPRAVRRSQRAQVAAGVARGVPRALGMTVISVFGISPKTHFAQVLVEADYRMKLIGIGLEPPPVKMRTFISELKTASHRSYMRWWFTPNYKCVKVSDNGLAMQLVGQGVRLLGEHMVLQADGTLVELKGTRPTPPSRIFTSHFTDKYPQIAARSPVFAELRNVIDLSVAAAFIRQQDYYGRAGWTMSTFADETALPLQTLAAPKTVAAAVNVVWKGNRLLAPGGGVSIQPSLALNSEHLLPDKDGNVHETHQDVASTLPADQWWWD